jgi:nucleoside-diphosphate-sugar epimerase
MIPPLDPSVMQRTKDIIFGTAENLDRNHGLDIRVARFHNIFGPQGTWNGGKEKAPAAVCRKVIEASSDVEIWGDGTQTRSFLYIDECLKSVEKFMESDFLGPINIGSEEMITINDLTKMVIKISNKNIKINNIYGNDFIKKYGYKCPTGVMGRTSDNKLFENRVGYVINYPLEDGIKNTYKWIKKQIENE